MTDGENGALFQVVELSKRYCWGGRDIPVLDRISLSVRAGEFAAIIGPSGCGKSTLFNLLAGLDEPDAGTILLDGRLTPHLRGRVAYMQQKDLLLPWRRLLDNVALGLEIQGLPRRESRRRARELLPVFGLDGFEDRYPDELSGGMRQRAALMRTVLCRRDILLLDEPFGALDAITRRAMHGWLLTVWRQFGASVLLVTHDVEEALMLADCVYVMRSRPGAIKAAVAVELPRPRRSTDPDLVRLKELCLRMLEEEVQGGAV